MPLTNDELQSASSYDVFKAIVDGSLSIDQFNHWLELQRQESYDDGVSDSYMYDGDADDD